MKSAVSVQCPKIRENAPGGSGLISLAAVIVAARNPARTRKRGEAKLLEITERDAEVAIAAEYSRRLKRNGLIDALKMF